MFRVYICTRDLYVFSHIFVINFFNKIMTHDKFILHDQSFKKDNIIKNFEKIYNKYIKNLI